MAYNDTKTNYPGVTYDETDTQTIYAEDWNDFVDEGTNEISTAYGYRWNYAFGFNQIENIIEKLNKDSSSRQQILMNWDPRCDNFKPAKNIPCPFATVVGINKNKLNLHLSVRSNDLAIGFPYDVFVYTLLGNMFANTLNVEPGKLHYSIANAHIYESHFSNIENLLKRDINLSSYPITKKFNLDEIKFNLDEYVKNINDDCLKTYDMNKNKLKFEILK
jgi:thymidylate synthase